MSERPDRETDAEPVVEIVGRAVAVRPVGEIDIATAPLLSRALVQALAHVGDAQADRIVTDCSRVTFCDSSGLNALLAARQTAVRAGTAIHLANPAPQLQRLLEITGAAPLFPREDDLPASAGSPGARLQQLPQAPPRNSRHAWIRRLRR
ncbi:STAS domain-containing protein [Streptomyces virginiae]|uniref:STAS domain-containing protein n=1 Tax=Streptomyces virginiae TaxID=1961 RepID=UPI002E35B9C4|nr:STAS domain-containing protein [Streptomyces virginiae]